MRPLHVILGLLTLTTVAAVSGCASHACGGVSGTGGGTGGSSSTATGQDTTGTGGSSSSGSCVAMGESCADTSLFCCGDNECIGAICQPCVEGISVSQCMCGDTPVGPASQSACTIGEGCGLDAGLPDGGDGGACQCVEMSTLSPCP